jgi:hypothetical protein
MSTVDAQLRPSHFRAYGPMRLILLKLRRSPLGFPDQLLNEPLDTSSGDERPTAESHYLQMGRNLIEIEGRARRSQVGPRSIMRLEQRPPKRLLPGCHFSHRLQKKKKALPPRSMEQCNDAVVLGYSLSHSNELPLDKNGALHTAIPYGGHWTCIEFALEVY